MHHPLQSSITRGRALVNRGKNYKDQGQVRYLTTHRDAISASVVGSETYRVRLNCENNRLIYSCTCPLGVEGNFCKHCVAVGLAWLDKNGQVETADSPLHEFLDKMDHDELVEFILEEASQNRHLRDQLELKRSRAATSRRDFH